MTFDGTSSLAPPTGALLFVLGGLAAFGPISTDLYLPALPEAAGSLRTTTAGIQFTLSASVIGLGAGQLVLGPLSDRFGRRKPLLIGLLLFVVFSVGCALATSVETLVLMRLGQALGGSAGLVISRAVVRDVFPVEQLARVFGLLAIASSLAPVLAPVLGSQLIRVVSWRAVFVVLAFAGTVLLTAAFAWVRESLPKERRVLGGVRMAVSSYGVVLRDRVFLALVGLLAATFAVLFTYISGSPFALQVVHGMSAQTFGLVFAANALCIMACAKLVVLGTPARHLTVATGVLLVGVGSIVGSVASGALWMLLAGFALLCCTWGLLAPTATALALARHPGRAGAAAAVQGALQFLVAGVVGPLAGVSGGNSLLGLAAVMVGATLVAVILTAVAVRHVWSGGDQKQQRGVFSSTAAPPAGLP